MIFSKNILVIAKIFGALLATNIPKMMQNFWSVSVTFSEMVLDQADNSTTVRQAPSLPFYLIYVC